LAIIGAGGSLGYLCSAKLSDYIPKITITDANKEKLYQLKERIIAINPIEIVIEDNVHNAVKHANIVINATRSPKALFSVDELK
jgi:ornithine cyclodeaminase/alanine dehydrogenase-like protein (mu-crystallin family)